MGLMDLLLAGPKIEEIKMAYVGRYVYSRIQDANLKDELYWHVNELANYNLYSGEGFKRDYLAKMEMRAQYIVIAMGLWEMNISHNLKNYQWCLVKRPLMVPIYDDALWRSTVTVLQKQCGISVEYIPRGVVGSEVRVPEK